jgi:hypothetical protein
VRWNGNDTFISGLAVLKFGIPTSKGVSVSVPEFVHQLVKRFEEEIEKIRIVEGS